MPIARRPTIQLAVQLGGLCHAGYTVAVGAGGRVCAPATSGSANAAAAKAAATGLREWNVIGLLRLVGMLPGRPRGTPDDTMLVTGLC